ncbi:hypothetical protein C7M84_009785 [Penaeus vannamei]|uniref:Uncharacterized protein n=1 Tax=Penaeus vannamei TaxID=6689 RepID=A0A3R7M3H2_PENVA|nr:hypothetical protein C7M84_009785 [Penaeus vannamei]
MHSILYFTLPFFLSFSVSSDLLFFSLSLFLSQISAFLSLSFLFLSSPPYHSLFSTPNPSLSPSSPIYPSHFSTPNPSLSPSSPIYPSHFSTPNSSLSPSSPIYPSHFSTHNPSLPLSSPIYPSHFSTPNPLSPLPPIAYSLHTYLLIPDIKTFIHINQILRNILTNKIRPISLLLPITLSLLPLCAIPSPIFSPLLFPLAFFLILPYPNPRSHAHPSHSITSRPTSLSPSSHKADATSSPPTSRHCNRFLHSNNHFPHLTHSPPSLQTLSYNTPPNTLPLTTSLLSNPLPSPPHSKHLLPIFQPHIPFPNPSPKSLFPTLSPPTPFINLQCRPSSPSLLRGSPHQHPSEPSTHPSPTSPSHPFQAPSLSTLSPSLLRSRLSPSPSNPLPRPLLPAASPSNRPCHPELSPRPTAPLSPHNPLTLNPLPRSYCHALSTCPYSPTTSPPPIARRPITSPPPPARKFKADWTISPSEAVSSEPVFMLNDPRTEDGWRAREAGGGPPKLTDSIEAAEHLQDRKLSQDLSSGSCWFALFSRSGFGGGIIVA